MAKTPDTSRTKARKTKRSPGAVKPGAAAPSRVTGKADARATKPGKSARAEPASAGTPGETASGRGKAKRAARATRSAPGASATPVVIKPTTGGPGVALSGAAVAGKSGKKSGKGTAVRRPSRQTFLIAATLVEEERPRLGVYAVVTRTPGEALSAVRDLLGAEVPVGLTGKLSGRMAKALGLKPGEVRRI